jgi:hypothetical protein
VPSVRLDISSHQRRALGGGFFAMTPSQASAIQRMLDDFLTPTAEATELAWEDLMPFEREQLAAARTLADGCSASGESQHCATLARGDESARALT